jgi:hypothetical protein
MHPAVEPRQWVCSTASNLRRANWAVISCAATSRVSCPPRAAIRTAVADIKPMERFAKVRLSALQSEMVVVTHQGVTVQVTPKRSGKLLSNWMNFS